MAKRPHDSDSFAAPAPRSLHGCRAQFWWRLYLPLPLLPLPLHRVIASPKEPTNGNDYAVPDIRDAGLPEVRNYAFGIKVSLVSSDAQAK